MKADRHLLVAASDKELVAAVGSAVQRLANLSLELTPAGAVARLSARAASAAALVVEVDVRAAGKVDEFRRLTHSVPNGRVVAAVREPSGEDVRRLFRAGAADVLTAPFTGEAVRASLSEILQTTPSLGGAGGQVISIVKGCGGAGATTLALNLAALMAAGDAKRGYPARATAVLDLDLQFGDTDVALDLHPRSTIVEVLKASERVDGRFLHGVMTEHGSGLKLLAPPPSIVPLDALSAEFATELIDHTADEFERTIVDLPATWTDWTLAALNRSDIVVVVSTATAPGALGARRALEALAEAGVRRPIFLVVNRLAGLLEAWEKPALIGKSLARKVDAGLALDPAALKAADRGQLVVDSVPKSRIAGDLRALAAKLESRLEAMAVGVALADVAA
jgi:pilus assembly protein CpaE